MNKQIEAMKLALKTLEQWDDPFYKRGRAIAVLQEALAEQPAQQEPCGWQFYQEGKWHNGMETNNHRANTEAAGVPVRDVYPSPQPAQPLTDDKYEAIVEDIAYWNRYVEVDTAHQSLEKHVREVLTAHGITSGEATKKGNT